MARKKTKEYPEAFRKQAVKMASQPVSQSVSQSQL
jgi:transposase-like protein